MVSVPVKAAPLLLYFIPLRLASPSTAVIVIAALVMLSLFIGAFVAIGGKWIPAMSSLYAVSWFSGFIISFVLYYLLMKKK